jgi:hypothetical protein|uniref:RING-type domain-containing protein n=1 Tax=viral metagenome TaxID=1070528 RepID=A0A6C0IW44_9ZZZZ
MESCNICCFQYSTLESSNNRNEIKLCCNHSLCEFCYIRLDKPNCPYCRLEFKYSIDDSNKRKLLNLEYFKWQPPSQISNYIPSPTINSIPRLNLINNENQLSQLPFSRIKRNTIRRRRRDLSFDEVIERRLLIKKRSTRKWEHKEARFNKETRGLSFSEEIDIEVN